MPDNNFFSAIRRRNVPPRNGTDAANNNDEAAAAAAPPTAATATRTTMASSSPIGTAISNIIAAVISDPNATVLSIAFDNAIAALLPPKCKKRSVVVWTRATLVDLGKGVHFNIVNVYIPIVARLHAWADRFTPAPLVPFIMGASLCCFGISVVNCALLLEALRAANGKAMDRTLSALFKEYKALYRKKKETYSSSSGGAEKNNNNNTGRNNITNQKAKASVSEAWEKLVKHVHKVQEQFADDAVDLGTSLNKTLSSSSLAPRLVALLSPFVAPIVTVLNLIVVGCCGGDGSIVVAAPRVLIEKSITIACYFVAFWVHRMLAIGQTAFVGAEIILRSSSKESKKEDAEGAGVSTAKHRIVVLLSAVILYHQFTFFYFEDAVGADGTRPAFLASQQGAAILFPLNILAAPFVMLMATAAVWKKSIVGYVSATMRSAIAAGEGSWPKWISSLFFVLTAPPQQAAETAVIASEGGGSIGSVGDAPSVPVFV